MEDSGTGAGGDSPGGPDAASVQQVAMATDADEATCLQGDLAPSTTPIEVPKTLDLQQSPPEDLTASSATTPEGLTTPPPETFPSPSIESSMTASSDSDLQTSTAEQSLNGFEFIRQSDVANADAAMAAESVKESVEELGAGDASVAKNDPKVMDVIGNGKIVKKIMKDGQGFESRPNGGDLVTLNYRACLKDGKKVEEKNGFQFYVGEGDVVTALDMCVALMELGEHAEITTVFDFAYGELGSASQPEVPPSATVVYDVELAAIDPPPSLSTMPFVERHKLIETKRLRGNYLFQRKAYSGAINSYSKAVTISEMPSPSPSEEEAEVQKDTIIKCQNNLAACQLKVEAYRAVLTSCDAVLNLDPSNVKACFRKGKALALLGEYSSALKWLRKAAEKEPNNKDIQRELNAVMKKNKLQNLTEREIYQRMMGCKPDSAGSGSGEDKGGIPYWKVFSGTAFATGVAAMSYAVFKMATETS